MPNCRNCGQENPEPASFCAFCGTELPKSKDTLARADSISEFAAPSRHRKKITIPVWVWIISAMLLITIVLGLVALGCLAYTKDRLHEMGNKLTLSEPSFKTRINPKDGAELVWIPGGEFRFSGHTLGYGKVVKPRAPVAIEGFWMYRYEVTNAQYRKFVEDTGHREPACWDNPNFIVPRQPVTGISWEDAKAYCIWAGVRLPRESEWEYAVRGGATGVGSKPIYKYIWGNTISPSIKVANLRDESAHRAGFEGAYFRGYDDGYAFPSPIGSFRPNRYGLYDMSGNAAEWCDMQPDEYAGYRVTRGGSWDSPPHLARVDSRICEWYTNKFRLAGLRSVMDKEGE